MKQITSFTVNHDYITPGIYISRIDGDITTFDLRTRTPNAGDYMDNLTMHSVEHMLATFLRNSEMAESVIYFGPMGCQTGFYLLTRDVEPREVLRVLKGCLAGILSYEGPMFGSTRQECGNYRNLSPEAAKAECERYLAVLNEREVDFRYAESE
ncbi:MAG: S-ribosylhomocysteine lyase [Ruminococcaceae bacterium]|nr:S-ribosylhomocysteine lyase [Oscillospiraceae bacterium]